MNRFIPTAIYLLLVGLTFIQAGASIFATSVNVSTLIEAPPASLFMTEGPYSFNPDVFWSKFPPIVFLVLIAAIIANWKSRFRKWTIAGGFIWVLAGVVAVVFLEDVQEEFLSAGYSDSVDPELMKLGQTWFQYSLTFLILSSLSGLVYLFGILSVLRGQRSSIKA